MIGCQHGGAVMGARRLQFCGAPIYLKHATPLFAGFFALMKYLTRFSPRTVAPMNSLRLNWILAGLCAFTAVVAAPSGPAFAQGKLEAQYEATLAGIPVGRGAWNIDISDDQYSASAVGGTAGLLKTFASGTGSSSAQGRVVNGALIPSTYTASTTTSPTRTTTAAHRPPRWTPRSTAPTRASP